MTSENLDERREQLRKDLVKVSCRFCPLLSSVVSWCREETGTRARVWECKAQGARLCDHDQVNELESKIEKEMKQLEEKRGKMLTELPQYVCCLVPPWCHERGSGENV